MNSLERFRDLVKIPLGSEDDIRVKLVIPFFKLFGYDNKNYELGYPIKSYNPNKSGRKPEADLVFFEDSNHSVKNSLIVVETKKNQEKTVEMQARFYSTNLWVPFYITWEKNDFDIYQIRNFSGITHIGNYSLLNLTTEQFNQLKAILSLESVKKFCIENEIKKFTLDEDLIIKYLNEYKKACFKFLNKFGLLHINKELRISEHYVPLYFREYRKYLVAEFEKDFSIQKHPEVIEYYDIKIRLHEISQMENFILIIGNPGSGKTTELKKYCLDLCSEKDLILPIFIPIRKLIAQNLRLIDYIKKELEVIRDDSKIDFIFDYFLYTGRLFIFADGLDELDIEKPEKARKKLLQLDSELQDIIRQNPENKIICSVRKESLVSVLTEISLFFKKYEILPFSQIQSELFIKKWFLDEKSIANKLIQELKDSNLRYLSRNPLLLSLICIYFDRAYNLPQKVSELYRRAINVLLEEWDATRRISRYSTVDNLTSDKIKDLLSEIALAYHRKGIACFEQENLIKTFATNLPIIGINRNHAKATFDYIRIQTGLLCSWAIENYYAFPHLSFQEYFVACALHDKEGGYDEIFENYNNPFWKQVLLFYSELGDATKILTKILNSEENILYQNLFIAAECLSRGPKLSVNPDLRDQIIHKLEELAKFEEPALYYFRKKAIKYIARIKSDTARAILKRLLETNKKTKNESYIFKYSYLILDLNECIKMNENSLLNDKKFSPYGMNAYNFLPKDDALSKLENLLEKCIEVDFLNKFKRSAFRIMLITNKIVEIGQKEKLDKIIILLKDSKIPEFIREQISVSLQYLQSDDKDSIIENLLDDDGIPSAIKAELAPFCGPLNKKAKNLLLSIAQDSNEDLENVRRFATHKLSRYFIIDDEDLDALNEVLLDSNPRLHWGTIAFAADAISKNTAPKADLILKDALSIWSKRKTDKRYKTIENIIKYLDYHVFIKKKNLTHKDFYNYINEKLYIRSDDRESCPVASLSCIDIDFELFLNSFPANPTDNDLNLLEPHIYRQDLINFSRYILNQKFHIKIRKRLLDILIKSAQLERKNTAESCWEELDYIWNQLEFDSPLRKKFYS